MKTIQEDIADRYRGTEDVRVMLRPTPTDRLQRLVGSMQGRRDLGELFRHGRLTDLALSLFPTNFNEARAFYATALQASYEDPEAGRRNLSERTFPSPELGVSRPFLPGKVLKQSMGIVGGGPAAIIMARIRTELGYPPESTTIYAPEMLGIWNQANVVAEGHNTFRSLSFFGTRMALPDGYRGEVLTRFLDQLRTRSRATHVPNVIHSVEKRTPRSRKYLVLDRDGTILGEHDALLIAPGANEPKPLEEGPMSTNALEEGLVLRRWQHQIKDPSKLAGKSPLFVGLGNSTLGMLRQLVGQRTNGVKPLVLTHHDFARVREASDDRSMSLLLDGNDWELIQRHPSDLTRLSLDIEEHRRVLATAVNRGWILGGVQSWEVVRNEPSEVTLKIDLGGGILVERVVSKPELYALIGYRPRESVIQRLGGVMKDGEIAFEPVTSVMETTFPHGERVYIAGAAASTKRDPNRAVIPGMATNLMDIAFTEATYPTKL